MLSDETSAVQLTDAVNGIAVGLYARDGKTCLQTTRRIAFHFGLSVNREDDFRVFAFDTEIRKCLADNCLGFLRAGDEFVSGLSTAEGAILNVKASSKSSLQPKNQVLVGICDLDDRCDVLPMNPTGKRNTPFSVNNTSEISAFGFPHTSIIRKRINKGKHKR